LAKIIEGSSYGHPFSWLVLKDQAHTAEKLGYARRTFQWQLAKLRQQGLVVGHHVVHRGHEVPCFTVSWETLKALSESAKVALIDLPNLRLYDLEIGSETPVIPGENDVPQKSVECNPYESPPTESSLTRTQLTEVRRLRRRRCRVHREEARMKLTNLGSDYEKVTHHQSKTPSVRIAEHFEAEWDRVRRAVPASVMMNLPIKPWPINGKSRFYGWVNKSLLPEVEGDLQAAEQMFTHYCDDVINRKIPRPPRTRPVHDSFAYQFENYRKPVSPTTQAGYNQDLRWG
jgi:hypothetical protein